MGKMPRTAAELIAWQKAGCPDWREKSNKPARNGISLSDETYQLLKQRRQELRDMELRFTLPQVIELFLKEGRITRKDATNFKPSGRKPGRPRKYP